MYAFQRCPGHQGLRPRDIEQRGRFYYQEGPKSLSATETRIAHGLHETGRTAYFAVRWRRRQQLIKQFVGIFGRCVEAREKSAAFFIHCFIAEWLHCPVLPACPIGPISPIIDQLSRPKCGRLRVNIHEWSTLSADKDYL